MDKIYHYHINQKIQNQSIEQFLQANGYSRKLLTHLKKTPLGITINQHLAYTTHILTAGELLQIRLIETAVSQPIAPVAMKLLVIYEDDDLLVINKPFNLPVHPSQGHREYTLANGVMHYFKEQTSPFIFRAVNRLDRDTTGLMIIAKHMLSASLLSQMVRDQTIHKEYVAAVSGCCPDAGTITAPIARVDGSTIERCVNFAIGESACTHFQRLYYHPDSNHSLIQLRPETGRTHQIRVHMKYIGHPLLGDFLYHPDYRLIQRQALHASKLTFRHPLTKTVLSLEAPLPKDMIF